MPETDQTKYLYAGARIKTLENEFLTTSQVDRLITASDWPQSYEALQATFIGPYISESDLDPLKPDLEPLNKALEKVITDTKKTLIDIAPDPNLLDMLWLKYDWHNLKVIILGQKLETNPNDLNLYFNIGKFTPEKLQKAYHNDQLTWLNEHLAQAARETQNITDSEKIGAIFNYHYLRQLQEFGRETGSPFIKRLTTLMIDLFNLKTGLRQLTLRPADSERVFVEGGSFTLSDLNNVENTLKAFERLGPLVDWPSATTDYQNTGSYTEIKKAAEEHLMKFLKQESMNIFSPATLFSYFNGRKNNVQMINIIMTGKQVNSNENDIRSTLRELYQAL